MRSSRTVTTDTCIAPGYETDVTRVSAGRNAACHGKHRLGSIPLAALAASRRRSQPQRGTP